MTREHLLVRDLFISTCNLSCGVSPMYVHASFNIVQGSLFVVCACEVKQHQHQHAAIAPDSIISSRQNEPTRL